VALTPAQRKIGEAWYLKLPAKRGIDIPARVYDQMKPVADGITMPMWGRPALPHQMAWLYEHGHTQPYQIHAAFSALPHPHAPNVKVGEYPDYVHALSTYKEHSQ
jgi:hypothetical protein